VETPEVEKLSDELLIWACVLDDETRGQAVNG
jgi:hypothetical protein